MNEPSIICIGHRGAAAYFPENTVASFDEAIRLGARAVEFDVHLSADNIPIVLHDATVNRTTNGSGPVSRLSRLELLRLDAGSWMHGRFAGLRIPTVDEALHAIAPHAQPIIELKASIPPPILLPLLEKHDVLNDALIVSFESNWLLPLKMATRELHTGLLVEVWRESVFEEAARVGAEVLGMDLPLLNPEVIRAALERSLEVWAFTANDVGMVAACAAMGVTGIITDKPDLIRSR